MARLNKKHGPGTALVGSTAKSYSRFPSGSLGLDLILGGGWPANQWHEIFGEASAGKTNLAFATIAANQRRDPDFTAVLIAAEEYVKEYAEMCGVDTERLAVVETCIMEDAYEAVMDFTESRAADCVVIDSLPMLVPGAEDEKEMDGNTVGAGARLTGKFFRKVGKATKRSLTEEDRPFLGIMLNQYRMKIGVMYGDPRTTPGGGAKDYAYFTRVEVARDEWIEAGVGKDKDRIGQVVRATTKKNKSAPPGQVARYDIYFDKGGPVPAGQVDYTKEIVTLGVLYEIVNRKGAWYDYHDLRAQGLDSFTEEIRANPEASAQIEHDVFQVLRVAA